MDTGALREALIKNLGSMAVGQGGNPDVYSAELDKQIGAAVAALAAEPGAAPATDQPVSDVPAPAAQDEDA